MPILEITGLRKTYTTRLGGNRVEALKNVSFTAEPGEYIAIMGESGSGKTTLLNILAALDKPTGGSVILDGMDLAKIKESKLADEPTGALDSRSSDELLALFAEINRRGQTILMVTHSAKAASRAKRVLFIKDGAVFHQLYRGNCSDDEFYRRITDALTLLSSSGEPQSLRIKREGAE